MAEVIPCDCWVQVIKGNEGFSLATGMFKLQPVQTTGMYKLTSVLERLSILRPPCSEEIENSFGWQSLSLCHSSSGANTGAKTPPGNTSRHSRLRSQRLQSKGHEPPLYSVQIPYPQTIRMLKKKGGWGKLLFRSTTFWSSFLLR